MIELDFCGKRISVFPESGDCIVYLHGDSSQAEVLANRFPNVTFAAIDGIDWNRDLSPWPAKAVFRGQPDFVGGAGEYLRELTECIVPKVEEQLEYVPARRILAGYSMAGMFAIYAGVNSDRFDTVASVSGSLWYPNFARYVEQAGFLPRCAYFSVGEREKLGRNTAFHSIETGTQRICSCLCERGVQTIFELNSGGHFDDVQDRMARAVEWIMRETFE